jgi:hypothetical protein
MPVSFPALDSRRGSAPQPRSRCTLRLVAAIGDRIPWPLKRPLGLLADERELFVRLRSSPGFLMRADAARRGEGRASVSRALRILEIVMLEMMMLASVGYALVRRTFLGGPEAPSGRLRGASRVRIGGPAGSCEGCPSQRPGRCGQWGGHVRLRQAGAPAGTRPAAGLDRPRRSPLLRNERVPKQGDRRCLAGTWPALSIQREEGPSVRLMGVHLVHTPYMMGV